MHLSVAAMTNDLAYKSFEKFQRTEASSALVKLFRLSCRVGIPVHVGVHTVD